MNAERRQRLRRRSAARPRVEVHAGVLFVVGAAGLALWHLPLDAAQEMSADELAEEFGYAAKSSCASLGDLWAAYKAQARHEGRRAA